MRVWDLTRAFHDRASSGMQWIGGLIDASTKFEIAREVPFPDVDAIIATYQAALEGLVGPPTELFYIERWASEVEKERAEHWPAKMERIWVAGGAMSAFDMESTVEETVADGATAWLSNSSNAAWALVCGPIFEREVGTPGGLTPILIGFDPNDPRQDCLTAELSDEQHPMPPRDEEARRLAQLDVLAMVLPSLTMLNTAGLKHVHQPAPAKLNKARVRKGKPIIDEHWTLKIDPSWRSERAPHQGGTHASPRLHIRRGHLRTYKRSGKVRWIRPMLVGRGELGTVTKEYLVRPKP